MIGRHPLGRITVAPQRLFKSGLKTSFTSSVVVLFAVTYTVSHSLLWLRLLDFGEKGQRTSRFDAIWHQIDAIGTRFTAKSLGSNGISLLES